MKSGILFFGLLLTFMLTANLASAQSCQPAACAKTAGKSTCAKATTTSTVAVTVDAMLKSVTNGPVGANCTKPCNPDKCTEEQKKNCAGTCPPGCCASGAKSMKTADAQPAQSTTKSSKL